MKKTVIIGATTNPSRYAYIAAEMLSDYNHEFIPLGIKEGDLFGHQIININSRPLVEKVDTVTMYIGPDRQPECYDYIISLKPIRIIFNPGTENIEFENLLSKNNIYSIQACTLVMLRTGQY